MNSKNILLILCCILTLVGWGNCAFAQPKELQQQIEKRYTLYFKLNQFNIDSKYKDNGATISKMVEDINNELEQEGAVPANLHIIASASPEGPVSINRNLALKRAEQAKKLLIELFPQYKAENIAVETIINSWDGVIQSIENNPQLKYREELLIILKDENLTNQQKDQAIRKMPAAFEQIRYSLMDNKRTASITFSVVVNIPDTTVQVEIPEPEPVAQPEQIEEPQPEIILEPQPQPLPVPERKPRKNHKVTLKTNLIGWGMGHLNIAAEIELAKHLSFALPFYYSGGFDYFKPTIKFRGIVVQPELRCYFKENQGFYAGIHAGLGWYNYALDGDYRIQDHKGHTPAYGGGLGLGYSHTFSKNTNWGMEVSVGGGIYKAKYDKFANIENGYYEESGVTTTFMGIDNVSVSFIYKFGNKTKKEGKR